MLTDEYFMNEALKEAVKAMEKDEVPVGAVLVNNQKIIARGFNQVEQLHDVTAHAEILCITAASAHYQNKYFPDCTLYVTLEPCMMCAAAIGWAQISRLVIGASDDKKGFTKFFPSPLHPKATITEGIMKEECATLILEFFRSRRKQ